MCGSGPREGWGGAIGMGSDRRSGSGRRLLVPSRGVFEKRGEPRVGGVFIAEIADEAGVHERAADRDAVGAGVEVSVDVVGRGDAAAGDDGDGSVKLASGAACRFFGADAFDGVEYEGAEWFAAHASAGDGERVAAVEESDAGVERVGERALVVDGREFDDDRCLGRDGVLEEVFGPGEFADVWA